jgi:hypothetical protein
MIDALQKLTNIYAHREVIDEYDPKVAPPMPDVLTMEQDYLNKMVGCLVDPLEISVLQPLPVSQRVKISIWHGRHAHAPESIARTDDTRFFCEDRHTRMLCISLIYIWKSPI